MTTQLGWLIRKNREAKGINQEAFAKAIDVTQQTISRWENGKIMPPIDRIPVLAEVLGVDRQELFDAASESRPNTRESRTDEADWKSDMDDRLTNLEQLLVELVDATRHPQRRSAPASKKAPGRAVPLKARKASQ